MKQSKQCDELIDYLNVCLRRFRAGLADAWYAKAIPERARTKAQSCKPAKTSDNGKGKS